MLNELVPIWVDSKSAVERLASRCYEARCMALDTEADSLHSYFHKVCLIQVSAGNENFIIDPLALDAERLGPLLQVTGDPGISTLLHGSDYDLRVLDRDFAARVRGLEDTQVMGQLLGEPRTGLAALLEQELGITLDKRFQRADWGKRPLPDEMLAYAAADTAHLSRLAARLRQRLELLGRWGWAKEEFQRLETVRYSPPSSGPLEFERLKGARALEGSARDRLATLYSWREQRARELDRPPFKVLGNRQLLDLATSPVRSLEELQRRPGIGRSFVRRWGRDVLSVLRTPDQAPPRDHRDQRPALTAGVRRQVKRLAAARDRVASALKLDPGLVCPRAVLTEIACRVPVPGSHADLETCGLSGWRLEVLGEQMITVLQDSVEH